MRKPIITCIILANLIACNDNVAEDLRLQSYSIDTNRITVSGLSSGGYMAGQLHLAHSSLFRGVAILAGGPYWCAEGSLSKGLGPCVAGGNVDVERLLSYARDRSKDGKIDALTNLSGDTVWLFHGSNDTAVAADVVSAAAGFYERLAPTLDIVSVTDVPAAISADAGAPSNRISCPCFNI